MIINNNICTNGIYTIHGGQELCEGTYTSTVAICDCGCNEMLMLNSPTTRKKLKEYIESGGGRCSNFVMIPVNTQFPTIKEEYFNG